MQSEEKNVTMAAKLYEVRHRVRDLLGDRFESKMAELGRAINMVVCQKHISHMSAAIELSKAASSHGDEMKSLMILAAAVEARDPSARWQA